jgi:outer membrane protein, adhesin transport system
MKIRKILIPLGALVCVLNPGFSSAETLQSAAQHAVSTNPEVQSMVKQHIAAEYAATGAYGGYLPRIDINAAYGRERTSNSTTRARNRDSTWDNLLRRNYGAELRQMVFDGFATHNEVKRTKAKANADAWLVAAEANNIAFATSESYINLLRQNSLVRASQDNVHVHRKILGMIRQRSESGVSKSVDMTQAEGRLALAQADYQTEAADRREAAIQYQRAVGRKPMNLVYPRIARRYMPRTEGQAIRMALGDNPQLHSANADVAEGYAQHHAAKSLVMPTLDIVLAADRGRNIDATLGRNDEYRAELQANWNVFNGGSDVARIRETAYLAQQSEEIRNNTYREVLESIRQSWLAYRTNQKLVIYYGRHMKSAKSTVAAYSEQFKLNQRTLLDLLDQQNEYYNARRSYLNSKYDVLLAQYRILNSMGHLLEALHIQLPDRATHGRRITKEELVQTNGIAKPGFHQKHPMKPIWLHHNSSKQVLTKDGRRIAKANAAKNGKKATATAANKANANKAQATAARKATAKKPQATAARKANVAKRKTAAARKANAAKPQTQAVKTPQASKAKKTAAKKQQRRLNQRVAAKANNRAQPAKTAARKAPAKKTQVAQHRQKKSDFFNQF